MAELLVIGGGPAGVAAALAGRAAGASVVLVEQGELGGTCVHAGCVPAGALHQTMAVKAQAAAAAQLGVQVQGVAVDWARMSAWASSVVTRVATISHFALQAAQVQVLHGPARFLGPGQLEAAGQQFQGVPVVVATGARSVAPQLPGHPNRPPLTNDTLLALDATPARVAVLGAGRFSLEWADLLREAGSQVTLIAASDRILPGEDAELAGFLQLLLEERGIRFLLAAKLHAVNGATVVTAAETLQVDAVVCADARVPNVKGLGLEAAGVRLGPDGSISVDQHQRTSAASVFAAGDVTGPPWLTNRAMASGAVAAANALGAAQQVRADHLPRSVNTRPPLAAVGLTAEQAEAAGRRVGTPTADLSLSARAAILGDPRGALKLVVDQDTEEILGAHMVGTQSTEVIAQVVLAMEAGIGYRQLLRPHHLHPSMAEVVGLAIRLEEFTRNHD